MKVLVTGAGGFSGRHLISHLRADLSAKISCASVTPRCETGWLFCDMTQKKAVRDLVRQVMPDQIYHLAGLNTGDYDSDYRVNVLSTKNLLEAIVEGKGRCRILLVGSSAEYGLVPEEDNPVKEDRALAPMSVYGLTKVYQTYLMKFYYSFHNLDVVMARSFNLLGRGAPGNLFIGRVYEQIEAFQAGRTAKIVVGNLENRRDYIPIEQAVGYYALIMQRGKPGEIYNVGSGTSIPIRDILKQILEENGLSMAIVEESKSELLHKFDIKNLVADIGKLNKLNTL
jgi:GDP-4-dehydro-6-deoxy-D-mannose reductase